MPFFFRHAPALVTASGPMLSLSPGFGVRRRGWPCLALAVLLTGLGAPLAVPAADAALVPDAAASEAATASPGIRRVADPVPGQYLVLFHDIAFTPGARAAGRLPTELETLGRDLAQRHGAVIGARWTRAVLGLAARMSEAAAQALAQDPRVALVEEDGRVQATAEQSPVASWGQDRVDQRDLPLDDRYAYATTAAAVTAYVIDTGIRLSHAEFGGRATWGANFTGDGKNYDCNDHGTHVAGTIGGGTYGLAKQVRLVAVKVLDCNGSGTYSGVVSGLDWVATNAQHPAVANMSLAGSTSTAVNSAVASTVAAGIPVAVAAGNNNGANACNYSPASAPAAITVGATTSSDARSSFSNIGTCLDLFAPGSSIPSAVATSDSATATLSGTSMASPHVAGAAALLLQADPDATPAEVVARLSGNASLNKLSNIGTGSPNRLLYTGDDGTQALTVSKNGTGSGTVTSNPAGIDCGPTCGARYPVGEEVTLTAAPADGSRFEAWGGACSGSAPTCTVTMSTSRAVTASFQSAVRTLTVRSSGAAAVAIAATPASYGGTTNYSRADIPAGTAMTLTAPATVGYAAFSRWSGCDSSAGTRCDLTLSADRTVTAYYTTPTFNLSVNAVGASAVAVTAEPSTYGGTTAYTRAAIPMGTAMTLTAPAAVGYAEFSGWTGCDTSSGNRCSLTLTVDRTLTAHYLTPSYELSVSASGAAGVAVAAVPADYGGYTDYSRSAIPKGTAISLTAPATVGHAVFVRWRECDTTSGTRCDLTLTADRALLLNYAVPTYSLHVLSSGAAGVAISAAPGDYGGTTNYTHTGILAGTALTLTAPATAGNAEFSGWTGCDSALARVCELTLTSERTISAGYTTPPPPLVTTLEASDLTANAATLHALVNPSGDATSLIFEYGPPGVEVQVSATLDLPAGMDELPAAIAVADLACGTTYSFRALATNRGGTTAGETLAFLTSPCGCEVEQLELVQREIAGEERHSACRTLLVGPEVEVASSGDLTLVAGEHIRLRPGLRVQSGGRLRLTIDPELAPAPSLLAVPAAAGLDPDPASLGDTAVAGRGAPPQAVTARSAARSASAGQGELVTADPSAAGGVRRLTWSGLPTALRERLLDAAAVVHEPQACADGSVLFATTASLVAEDANARSDVYLYQADGDDLLLVSRATSGQAGNGPSGQPRLAVDCGLVLYRSAATDLVAGPANGFDQLYLYDLAADWTRRLTDTPVGDPGGGDSDQPVLAGDWALFRTVAPDLAATGAGLYRQHLVDDWREPVGLDAQGWPDPAASQPAADTGGERIAYRRPGVDGRGEIYLFADLAAEQISPAADPGGVPPARDSPVLSADGRFLAYREVEVAGPVWLQLVDLDWDRALRLPWPTPVERAAHAPVFAAEGRTLLWLNPDQGPGLPEVLYRLVNPLAGEGGD